MLLRRLDEADDVAVLVFHRRDGRATPDVPGGLVRLRAGDIVGDAQRLGTVVVADAGR